jgi:hypothetical protein
MVTEIKMYYRIKQRLFEVVRLIKKVAQPQFKFIRRYAPVSLKNHLNSQKKERRNAGVCLYTTHALTTHKLAERILPNSQPINLFYGAFSVGQTPY